MLRVLYIFEDLGVVSHSHIVALLHYTVNTCRRNIAAALASREIILKIPLHSARLHPLPVRSDNVTEPLPPPRKTAHRGQNNAADAYPLPPFPFHVFGIVAVPVPLSSDGKAAMRSYKYPSSSLRTLCPLHRIERVLLLSLPIIRRYGQRIKKGLSACSVGI